MMLVILQILSILQLLSVVSSSSWCYDETQNDGPFHWYTHYENCDDNNQSPINIVNAIEDDDLEGFRFRNYEVTNGVMEILKNDGHSAKLTCSGVQMTLTGGDLGETFIFEQLHFHWGHDDSLGSEHTVNGMAYPMEMHLVHYASSYGSFANAVDKPNGLAVLGFFFQISEFDNPNLQNLVDALDVIPNTDETATVAPFSIYDLIAYGLGPYYRYYGSLTTPPCYESVIWTVFARTIPISSSQMSHFRTLFDDHAHVLEDNFRPTQPLNSRSVYYYAGDDDSSSS
uniref:Carbonic anhydrase n=1 Tax=Hydroides elegans TaxID=216498 RepID=A0A191ZDM0_HYDEL|nr:carbonic anhydrase [Hydroides elegans]